jgi:single-stranded-DNA-specific exonuclease
MAERQLEAQPERAILAVQSSEWHPGIVGLVASRLKERFRRPAFALALNEAGQATGSGRSIAGVDLGRAVRMAVDAGAAIKGGGHAMAAGVTLAPDGLAAFETALTAELKRNVDDVRRTDVLPIDAALTAGSARVALLNDLENAGPFGAGSPEPIFVFPGHRLVEVAVVGTGGHVRIKLRAGDGAMLGGIVFRAADEPLGRALLAARGEMVHLVGTLSIDRWGGGEKVQLRVVDMARS